MDDVRVNRSLVIPEDEIEMRFSTSGGPGGQHANKAATRVELTWNVAASRALGPRQRARIEDRLRTRIDSSGALRLTSNKYRSQWRNREDVLERLGDLVADALRPVKKRVGTKPTQASKERRLLDKRRRSAIKRGRKLRDDEA
ncbi:MAG: alternative ribosome rescue aminoacyl-tRNA hydrolase ArfB [Actinomycetota bacterium]